MRESIVKAQAPGLVAQTFLSAVSQAFLPAGRKLVASLSFATLALAPTTFAATATLHPVADTTLIEAAPGNSSGGQSFFVAGTTQNLTRNRGLLRFDLASVIPADATIVSATLDVDAIYQSVVGQENSLFGLYRMLKPWNEGNNVATDNAGGRGAPALAGDATWASRIFPTVPWNAPGGTAGIDYAGSFSSSAFISGVGTYNFESTLDTVADAQQWLTHPEANYGWMLVCQSEDLAFTARRFASSEDGTGGPLLTLEYTLVPEPFTLAFLPFLLVGFLLIRRP